MTNRPISTVFRDFEIDHVPASGLHKPIKRDIRDTLNALYGMLSGANAGALIYTTLAALVGNTTAVSSTMAWVINDPVAANNGVYQFFGATTWTKRAPLPYNIVQLNNANLGTPNAIQATTAITPPTAAFGVLFVLNVTAENTGPVTVAINGETPKPLVTNVGSPIASNYLKPGMALLCVDDGIALRLLTPGDIEASIEAIFAEFQTMYLGAFDDANEPTTDLQGNPLIIGAEYFNTDDDVRKTWSGSAWIDATAIISAGSVGDPAVKSPSSLYNRLHASLNILDYATTAIERESVRNGFSSVKPLWDLAIADAATKGRKSIVFPDGEYLLTAGQTLSNPGLKVRGQGNVVIKRTGVGAMFRNVYTLPTLQSYFLNATAPENARSITMTSSGVAANFAAGQWAILRSSLRWNVGNPQRTAEYVKIRSVSGATINLWGPLKESYLIADTPELIPVTLTEGIEYNNIEFQMDKTVAVTNGLTDDLNIRVIDTLFALRPVFRNITMRDANAAGVALEGCINARVTNLSCYDFGSSNDDATGLSSIGNGGYGYAICERGLNQGLIATVLHVERCRHAYTTGASYIFTDGRPSGSIISNGVHIDSKEAGWDTHGCGIDLTFINVHTIGSGRTGFQFRARRTKAFGISAKNTFASGLWLVGADSGDLLGDDCYIDGVVLENTNFGFGEAYDSNINWRETPCIRDQGIRNIIKNFKVDTCGGPAYGTNSSTLKPTLKHGEIRNPCQLNAGTGYAITYGHTVADTPILDDIQIFSDDGRVADLVRVTQNTFNIIPLINNVKGYGNTGINFSSAAANNSFVHWTNGNGGLTNGGGYRETLTLSGTTTFSLKGKIGSRFNVNSIAAVHLVSITDATEGMRIQIYGATNPLNVDHGSGTDQIFLIAGSGSKVITSNQAIELERRGTLWYEI